MKQIGPIMQLADGEPLLMQDAIECDTESGAHWLSNEKAKEINRLCPTILAMAALIEKERDKYRAALKRIASHDFRGNQSPESQIAHYALKP